MAWNKRSKYNARKVQADGQTFDSVSEFERYLYLKSEEEAGRLSDLVCQPRFILVEGFRDMDGNRERPVHYTADFQYNVNGVVHVEDVKSAGTKTARDYSIRRKLFKRRYPTIRFVEVQA